MNISYNIFSKKDTDGIFEISNMSFKLPWSIESIKSEIDNPLAKYVVAKDIETNKVLGFIGIWVVLGEGDITNIAVHPDFRKLGIGEKLLSSMISLCDSLDCNIINLEVRKSNLPAISLYEKFGFFKIGLRKGYYDNKEDAILMQYRK
ncbi:ribosomal protein S18-alanine N-acetyltransferase [Clostridium sp.]|uniref:ribosomal protein S18-alanine N-acetyltransferase n=1 Tax=Clostridium sp. TaxID=1506 RepID=UPI00262653A9|nr:ribosomal protein S18-alanine N-acetyltransferase [Clostridium sp.]